MFKFIVYNKSSFQENLFDGFDVDQEEYEISVKCPKKKKNVTTKIYSTTRWIKTIKNFHTIKRPVDGNLKLKLFCYYCEKYYRLKINSDVRHNKKKKLLFLIYILLMISFWYSNLPIGSIKYVVWMYFFYKIYQALNTSFVEASNKHNAKIIRKWQATEITHQN